MSDPSTSVLLTDLYQLTMLQAYAHRGMDESAVFEMFVRRLPASRRFLLAAGLEQALAYLEELRFSVDEIEWLAQTGRFRDDFLDVLAALRFRGDVHAMPEGTPFFANEPVLRVTAPLPQAQLVESRLINILQFQTMIASKAARSVLVAPDKHLVDFGMRRAHGAEAGLLAARAAYLAGFSGSATVLAGRLFDVPIFGTMAHSFVQAHENEAEAFAHFADANPGNVVLLVDSYDTTAAARQVVTLAPKLSERGLSVAGVRLDSGDLSSVAREVRSILDDGGLSDVAIFASGNLDEYAVRDLVDGGVPIDGYGIGSRLDVSEDAPYLDVVYKLQEYAGRARRKRSEGKATWPGRKQVFRSYDSGVMCGDVVALEDDSVDGEALLEAVMIDGQRVRPSAPLSELRDRTRIGLQALPSALRSLEEYGDGEKQYPVRIAESVQELALALDRQSSPEASDL